MSAPGRFQMFATGCNRPGTPHAEHPFALSRASDGLLTDHFGDFNCDMLATSILTG